MSGLRLAGVLWIIDSVICAGLFTVVLIGENLQDLGALIRDPGLPTLVLVAGIAALVIGVLLISRPGPAIVRASSVAGVAWLLVFGYLLITALGKPDSGPVLSTSLITGFAVAGALVTYRSRSAARRPA